MFKRKHKNIPFNAPTKLWLKKSFDFVVPHSFEDCCSHIETFDDGFLTSYRVYLTSIGQQQIAFNISRRAGNSGTVWAVGYLEAIEDHSTHIVGKAGVPIFDIVFVIWGVAIIGLVAVLDTVVLGGLFAVCFITFFIAFFEVIIWTSLWRTRDGLIDKLRHE